MNSGSSSGAHKHTLSVASLYNGRAIVLGLTTKIIFASFCETVNKVLSVNDGQVVRGVCFLQSSGDVAYVVSGGDGKKINVYGVSLMNAALDKGVCTSKTCVDGLNLVFSFGPHTKRITHVTTCGNNTILFADKFGEVYRLEFECETDGLPSLTGNHKTKSIFLMQHFSMITTFFLSAPIGWSACDGTSLHIKNEKIMSVVEKGRRLFTFDKDCHARVSCFPDVFQIEQFLWTEAPQSVVTSIAEILALTEVGDHSYFVTGCYDGKVHLWVADNALENGCLKEPFTLLGSLSAQELAVVKDEETISVVSVVYVVSSPSGELDVYLDREFSSGILIAYAGRKDVVFVPFENRGDDHRLSFSVENATSVSLESSPLVLIKLDADSVFTLERNGNARLLRFVNMEGQKGVVCRMEDCYAALEATVGDIAERYPCGLLEEMDLFAQWKYDAVDPRARKKKNEENLMEQNDNDEDDDSDDDNDDDNKRNQGHSDEETGKSPMEKKEADCKRIRTECEDVA